MSVLCYFLHTFMCEIIYRSVYFRAKLILKCALLMVLMAGFSFFYFKDLVEKVMILRKSIERLRNCEVAVQSPILAEKLTCYAGILAAEGSLTTAMTYLPENSDQVRSSFVRNGSAYI